MKTITLALSILLSYSNAFAELDCNQEIKTLHGNPVIMVKKEFKLKPGVWSVYFPPQSQENSYVQNDGGGQWNNENCSPTETKCYLNLNSKSSNIRVFKPGRAFLPSTMKATHEVAFFSSETDLTISEYFCCGVKTYADFNKAAAPYFSISCPDIKEEEAYAPKKSSKIQDATSKNIDNTATASGMTAKEQKAAAKKLN